MIEHCAFCGGKLTHDSQKHTCTKCAKTFYDNPKAAVVVMLYTPDKKYLVLARRAKDPETGKIDFIGGFLNVGEGFDEAAYREMEEESGLKRQDVGELMYVGSIYNDYKWEGIEIPTTSVCFLAELKSSAKIMPADDVGEIVYRPIKDLELADDYAWLNMKSTVLMAAQRLAEI